MLTLPPRMIGCGRFSLIERVCEADITCANDLNGGGTAAEGGGCNYAEEEGAVGAANSAYQSKDMAEPRAAVL